MSSNSTLDDKIEGTNAGILGQVHKVNQQVNDLRTEITKVSDSFKSKHKEVHESLDHLLRHTVIGQVHKVNQHVNDFRTEIARVSDSFKSKHKEVHKSLDHLLRHTEQSSTPCPTIPRILPSYSIISPSFGMPPNTVPHVPTNTQASTVPSIVDTHCPSMVPTKNVASNEAPISSGNTSVSQVDEENIVPINSSTFTVTTPTGP